MAEVRRTLADLGLAPTKSRGQNFLKDPHQINRIVAAVLAQAPPAGPSGPGLVEIGPGLGALTRPLLDSGARVLAVELDRGLAENLGSWPEAGDGRLKVLPRDVLTVGPEDLGPEPGPVCGNLPYNISSPILFWFLALRRRFTGAVFMLQKEMARRLTAGPGSKDYGRLAVALSLWCRVEELFEVPPAAFHPRPRVDSAVVRLTPLPPELEPKVTPERLGRFTAAAFAARRKTVFNNLSRAYGRTLAAGALAGLDLDPGRRAETLTPAQLAALAEILEK